MGVHRIRVDWQVMYIMYNCEVCCGKRLSSAWAWIVCQRTLLNSRGFSWQKTCFRNNFGIDGAPKASQVPELIPGTNCGGARARSFLTLAAPMLCQHEVWGNSRSCRPRSANSPLQGRITTEGSPNRMIAATAVLITIIIVRLLVKKTTIIMLTAILRI